MCFDCSFLPSSGSSELPNACGNCSLEHAGGSHQWWRVAVDGISEPTSISNLKKSLTIPSVTNVMKFALSSGRSLMWSPVE